jgi:hypothetical protein
MEESHTCPKLALAGLAEDESIDCQGSCEPHVIMIPSVYEQALIEMDDVRQGDRTKNHRTVMVMVNYKTGASTKMLYS